MYRYITRESCSQFDSLPLTYLALLRTKARALLAEAQTLAFQVAATGYPMLIQCIDVFAACLRTVAWARCAIACLDLSERPLVHDVCALTQLGPHVPLTEEVRA